MEIIKINHPKYDKPVMVVRNSYEIAKLADLKAFGYSTLTFEEVHKQVSKVLSGEELSVIGKFIESDIVLD